MRVAARIDALAAARDAVIAAADRHLTLHAICESHCHPPHEALGCDCVSNLNDGCHGLNNAVRALRALE